MHNLHLILVNSDSPELACEDATGCISHWGTDNNWRLACGAVNLSTGEIYSTGEGRYDPKECLNETSSINFIKDNGGKKEIVLKTLRDMVLSWADDDNFDILEIKKSFDKLINNEKISEFEIYAIEKYVAHKRSTSSMNLDELLPQYRPHEYDETGLTDFTEHNEGVYCVFIDMHS
jgi:hypothetical protein